MKDKPRKPWLAGVLTFFTLGLGHIYYGEFKRGLLLFVGGQLLLIIAFSSFLFYAPVGPIISVLAGISYIVYCIIDSVKGTKNYQISYPMKKYNKWYIYLLYWFVASFVIQTIVETGAKKNIAQAYKIPTGAMLQTIQLGDYIIANKFIYKISEPKRGDIVIFPSPEEPTKAYIKRVIALEGETLEIIDKKILIDGNVINEAYVVHMDKRIFPKDSNPRDNFGPITIPVGSVFVMGDNRDNSQDSRFWGYVKKSSIKGKAINIYWSWDNEEFRVRWERIGKKFN